MPVSPEPGAQSEDQTQGGLDNQTETQKNENQETEDLENLDDSALENLDPKKASELIRKLRRESAGHRKKAKTNENNVQTLAERLANLEGGLKQALGLEGDAQEGDLAEEVQNLRVQNEQVIAKAAILESAWENGITHDEFEFYEFLLAKRVNSLEEGQEFGEEDYAEIIEEVRKRRANPAENGATSVKSSSEPKPGGKSGVSLDEFVKMNIGEKTLLYQKSPDTYTSLMAQARGQGKIK